MLFFFFIRIKQKYPAGFQVCNSGHRQRKTFINGVQLKRLLKAGTTIFFLVIQSKKKKPLAIFFSLSLQPLDRLLKRKITNQNQLS